MSIFGGLRTEAGWQRRRTRLEVESLERRILLQGVSPDIYEPNDTFNDAADLGEVTGTEELQGLTVHQMGDDDYFLFTTVAPGTDSDYVQMELTEGYVYMGLALYDSNQNHLDSRDGDSTLQLPLQDIPAGTYYLRAAGMEGSDATYDLTFVTPTVTEGDPYEVNDDFGTATDLGEVFDAAYLDQPTIHNAEDEDYFRFTILDDVTPSSQGGASFPKLASLPEAPPTPYVEIQFDHSQGDLDMSLYDESQNYLRSSKTLTDNELISLDDLPAGTYYARVYGYEGALNSYELSVVAAPALGPDAHEPNDIFAEASDFGEVGGWRQVNALTVHDAQDEDYFAFTTVEGATLGHYVEIQFDTVDGDLDLELYDGTEHLLRRSASGTDDERIGMDGLPAGKYYLRVLGHKAAVNQYDLLIILPGHDWASDDYEYNDHYDSASNLGELEGTREIQDLTIDAGDDLDYFKFTTLATATTSHYLQLDFTHGDGNVDMELYDLDRIHVLGVSTTPTDGECISLAGLPADSYYLLVYGRAGATNGYDLTIEAPRAVIDPDDKEENDTPDSGTDLGDIAGVETVSSLTIHDEQDEDYFIFRTVETSTASHYVSIDFSHAEGDLDLELYDGAGNHILSSTSASDDELVSMEGLAAGTYMAHVFGYSGAKNEYDLTVIAPYQTLAPDAYEPNDSFEDAIDLREIVGTETLSDLSIHDGADADYFSFSLVEEPTSSHYARITFAHADGNLNLTIYDENEYSIGAGVSVTDDETVSLADLPPGTYYAKITGLSGQTNSYDLEITARGALLPDMYESNDSFVDATNLGQVEGTLRIPGLTVHSEDDQDFFRIVTQGIETTSHYVEIEFAHDDGDLDLLLFDEEWGYLAESDGREDNESLRLAGLPAGSYYVEVKGHWTARNSYELVVHAPGGLTPDGWENSEPVSLRGNQQLENMTIHDPAEWDDYGTAVDSLTFTTAATSGPAHYVQIDFAHADGDLNLRLLDSMGRAVRDSWSNTDDERVELEGLRSGTYTAQIFAQSGITNTYDFTVHAPMFTGPPLPEWTLLFYYDGDDISGYGSWSCETYAVDKVNELEAVELPYDVRAGVLLDRIEGYEVTDPDWTDTRVGVLRHDSDPDVMATQFDRWEPEERNIGLSYTLRDYINWAGQALPAQNYALFLFDHGGGFYGVCWDETSGNDQLTLGELRDALDQSGPSVDVIGFDACLMGMTEVASALAGSAEVMVGSEEVEYVPGWDVGGFMERVAEDPFCSAEQMGSHLVESFADYWGNESTLSAIDIRTNALASSLTGFANVVDIAATSSDWQAMAAAREATPAFKVDDFRDLGHFMAQVMMRTGNWPIRWAASNVLTTLNSSVVANHSGFAEQGTGLSIYLPGSGDAVMPFYRTLDFGDDTGWLNFLEELVSVGIVASVQPDWAENNDAMAVAYDLETLTGENWVFPLLTMHTIGTPNGPFPSDDWFKFTTRKTGEADDEVRIEFDNGEGNLDLALFTEGGIPVDWSITSNDVETVSLEGLVAGTYYVRVVGRNGAENPNYTMTIDAPPPLVIPVDWAAGNVAVNKAHVFNLHRGAPLAGLYVGSGEEDWFSFPTSMLGWQTSLNAIATYPVDQYDLTLTLCDPQGQSLATSEETADGAVLSFAGVESGEFFLQVTTPGTEFVPYSLVVTENVGPGIALNDPPAGAGAGLGEEFAISWYARDPDDNASISLYWDTDADPENNDAGSEGDTWGRIADGLGEDSPANSYNWTVNVPRGGQYYLYATAEDALLTDTDYTASTLAVGSMALIESRKVDGATISVYDVDPANGISAPHMAWSASEFVPGKTELFVNPGRVGDGVISSIGLYGDGTGTADLGIVVENNMQLQRVFDARRGTPALAFLASEGYVGSVSLKTGMTGANLNGFVAPSGWALPADIDGDGSADDPTALYTEGGVRILLARGDVEADVVAGAEMAQVTVLGGDLNGDVTVASGDIGRVLARGRYDRGSGAWTGGSITGHILNPSGNIRHVMALHGDIAGDIDAGGGVTLVKAMGDISGDVHAGGDLRVLQAIGGDITGLIDVGGNLITAMAIERSGQGGNVAEVQVDGDLRVLKAVDGDILGPVAVEGNATLIQSIGGDIAGPVDVNGNLTMVMAVERGGEGGGVGEVDVEGSLRVLKTVGGDVAGPVTVGSDAILILAIGGDVAGFVDVEGDLRTAMAVARGAGGAITGGLDVEGSMAVLKAVGGSVTGPVEVAGDLNLLQVVNGSLAAPVTVGYGPEGGQLRSLLVIGGNIEQDVDVAGNLGVVVSTSRGGQGGSATGDLEAGGRIGALLLDDEMRGDVRAAGSLGRLSVRGDITGSTVQAESLSTLSSGGSILNSLFSVDEIFSKASVWGDLANTTIQAGELGRVVVRGTIWEDDTDGDQDEIHALTGRFFVRDRRWPEQGGWVPPERHFDGVRAWVG